MVGMGERGGYIASDIPAILEYTRDVHFMTTREIAVVKPEGITFLDAITSQPVQRTFTHIDWDVEAAQKGNFEHFMLKEIHDEPRCCGRPSATT